VAEQVGDEELLAEQRRFYERRAPEYDEWWQRRGCYDQGTVEKARWDEQVRILEEALKDFDPRGDVLELAGGAALHGSLWWTRQRKLWRSTRLVTRVLTSGTSMLMSLRGRRDIAMTSCSSRSGSHMFRV
jgi:hypothetical protein